MLSAPMMQRLEGAHVGFLWQVKRNQAIRRRDGSWRQVTAETVLHGAGTQPIRTYVDMQQAAVAEWVALRPIFDVCTRKTGYEGGGRLGVPWWRQEAAENQLKVIVGGRVGGGDHKQQLIGARHGTLVGWLEIGDTQVGG